MTDTTKAQEEINCPHCLTKYTLGEVHVCIGETQEDWICQFDDQFNSLEVMQDIDSEKEDFFAVIVPREKLDNDDYTSLEDIKLFIAAQRQQAAEEATKRERERCLECVGEEVFSEDYQYIEADKVEAWAWRDAVNQTKNEIRDKIKNGGL